MEIKLVSGDISRVDVGSLVVGMYEGTTAPDGDLANLDKLLGGAVAAMLKAGEIKGKLGELTIINSLGKLSAEWLAVLGLGKQQDINLQKVRGALADACRALQKKHLKWVAVTLASFKIVDISAEALAHTATEAALLGTYGFKKYFSKDENEQIEKVSLVAGEGADLAAMGQGICSGRIIAEAVNRARDLSNEPSNIKNPAYMADAAKKMAEAYGLECNILEREDMNRLGMGGLLGVSQGSDQPPKFIVLTYKGRPENVVDLALVGKAITFDSGGISIKPSEKMGEMKGDMSGGGAVIMAMSAIAQLKPVVNVTGIVPAAENMPSGGAIRPGDVLRTASGKTIEVMSTDAEGRMILADGLDYAVKLGAKRIVDIATLTGSCQMTFANVCSGGFSTNQALLDEVIAAGAAAGERIWQLPLYEEYKELNKSNIADLKNSGGRLAGAITAAFFLAEFAGQAPWVHLDIAGTDLSDKEKGIIVKGATGVGVSTMVNLAMNLKP